jgi:dTDP-4-dehydrorhamnose 3,5-epimerase
VKIETTELLGVYWIEPRVFRDERGSFQEIYSEERLRDAGIEQRFVQHNESFSHQGVLRGLHYQVCHPQSKLIWVPEGRIFDVAVDLRQGSPTFGKWTSTELSYENRRMALIGEGFAHGFYALERSRVSYLCGDFYRPDCERGVRFSDPQLAIAWPIADDAIVSERDRALPLLEELAETDLPKC